MSLKKNFVFVLLLTILFSFSLSVSFAQLPFGIKDAADKIKKDNQGDKTNPTKNETGGSVNSSNNKSLKERIPTETTVIKQSLQMTTKRVNAYYRNAKGEREFGKWSWIPRFDFEVTGPIQSGGVIQVEFFEPNNKPWLIVDVETPELQAGSLAKVEPKYNAIPEEKSSIATGLFTFKINLKNELEGTKQTLYEGKFTVNKYHVGNNLPEFKNQFEFYIEHDWQLPVGYILTSKNKELPLLNIALWFRNKIDSGNVVGYLFYKGKEISNTKTTTTGSANGDYQISTSESNWLYTWSRYRFVFFNVALLNQNPSVHPDIFELSKNPGEYEIKVLRDGRLARTAKFTVKADGSVEDNGLLNGNKFADGEKFNLHAIVPANVLGEQDGMWNMSLWKTDAFYANPITGFALQ